MTHLSTIEYVFEIDGRGCVIAPAFAKFIPPHIKLRRHDSISLKCPDGTTIETHIHELEHLDGPNLSCVAIVLPAAITKADVPIGTEIWLPQGKD